MIDIKGLVKRYGLNTALRGVDLFVECGASHDVLESKRCSMVPMIGHATAHGKPRPARASIAP